MMITRRLEAAPTLTLIENSTLCDSYHTSYDSNGIWGFINTRSHHQHGPGQWLGSRWYGNVAPLFALGLHLNATILDEGQMAAAESLFHGAVWFNVIRGLASRMRVDGESNHIERVVLGICSPFSKLHNKDDFTLHGTSPYTQCLHGAGHGVVYFLAFQQSLFKYGDFSACTRFPHGALADKQAYELGDSACFVAATVNQTWPITCVDSGSSSCNEMCAGAFEAAQELAGHFGCSESPLCTEFARKAMAARKSKQSKAAHFR